jgi:hypothetical protein
MTSMNGADGKHVPDEGGRISAAILSRFAAGETGIFVLLARLE